MSFLFTYVRFENNAISPELLRHSSISDNSKLIYVTSMRLKVIYLYADEFLKIINLFIHLRRSRTP